MIMPRGQQLLLPVNPLFIGITILVAFICSLLPLGWVWMPDLLLLVLTFWGVHQPLRVGMGVAFFLGLGLDVQQSALMGQHALAYVLVMFVAYSARLRLLWFPPLTQALLLLPVFFMAHGLQMLVRMASGGLFPGPWLLLAPILETLLWPFVTVLLLAPQRRAPDTDDKRPL